MYASIWRDTGRGAGVGARLGVIIWLAANLFSLFDFNDFCVGGVSFWLLIFRVLWSKSFMPKDSEISSALEMKYFIPGIAALLLAMSQGPGFTLKGSFVCLTFACQIAVGAMVAGSLVCVWPGMMIGTIVGITRLKRFPKPLSTSSDVGRLMALGLFLPLIVFPLVVWIYLMLLDYANALIRREWIQL